MYVNDNNEQSDEDRIRADLAAYMDDRDRLLDTCCDFNEKSRDLIIKSTLLYVAVIVAFALLAGIWMLASESNCPGYNSFTTLSK